MLIIMKQSSMKWSQHQLHAHFGFWYCRFGDRKYIWPMKNLCHLTPNILFWNKWRKNICLMTSFPGQPGQACSRKMKPWWILMRQQIMKFWYGTGIGQTIMQTICTSLQTNKQVQKKDTENRDGTWRMGNKLHIVPYRVTSYTRKCTGT